MQSPNANGFMPLDGGSNLPGGGQFGNLFGNTNAAMSTSPLPVDPPGPAQHEPNAGFAPLPGPTDGSTGGIMIAPGLLSGPAPTGSPVTAPVVPGTSPLQPGMTDIGHNFGAVGPLDPALTTQLFQYLQGMIGKGASGFTGTTTLPSGGTTGSGDLSAPLNDLMKQLQSFYSGGATNAPGLNSLTSFASNGQPIDQTPAWQAMVDSMQKHIGENQANLKEQFNFGGNLASSPFGNAMSDYMTQTSKDQNAMLLSAQAQAMEAAKGRQLNASEGLLSGNQQFAGITQGLDQNAINAKLQEFLRTQPEYSPLLNMQYGAGTTFPPIANFNSGIGVLGSLLQNAGGIGDLLSKIGFKFPSGSPGAPGAPGPSGAPAPSGSPLPQGEPSGGTPTHNPSDYQLDPNTGLMVPIPWAGGGGNPWDLFGSGTGDITPPDSSGLGLDSGLSGFDWGSLLGSGTGGVALGGGGGGSSSGDSGGDSNFDMFDYFGG